MRLDTGPSNRSWSDQTGRGGIPQLPLDRPSTLYGAASLAATFRSSARRTVLVVEDDEGARRLAPLIDELSELADQSGANVVICSGGSVAAKTNKAVTDHCHIDMSAIACSAARAAGIDDATIERTRARRGTAPPSSSTSWLLLRGPPRS